MAKVIIDIGHYKCDSGAVATHGGVQYKEVDFNLSISEKVKTILESKRVTTVFTSGSLGDRTAYENRNGCDYFVSIHANSGGGTGTETLIHSKGGKAELLGKVVQANLGNQLSIPNRGVRVAKEYLGYDLAVLKGTKAPAILVECGFIDSKIDIEVLKHQQNKIATAIGEGILKQLNIPLDGEQNTCDCCYCKSLRK